MKNEQQTLDELLHVIDDPELKKTDEGNEIRAKAAETLGKLSDARAIELLLILMQNQDEDGEVRVQAILSLERV